MKSFRLGLEQWDLEIFYFVEISYRVMELLFEISHTEKIFVKLAMDFMPPLQGFSKTHII